MNDDPVIQALTRVLISVLVCMITVIMLAATVAFARWVLKQ